MEITTMDLNFMGEEAVIGSFLLTGESGEAAIVETGPATCLDAMIGGLKSNGVSPEDVRQVFLTHIHLDHAGASGHLAELLPNAIFYVHEVGYPHVADPSRLLKSAARLFGDRMENLWGEMRPVPEDRLVSLAGGEEIGAAGGVLSAHYTPGHAYHHLAYREQESGAIFCGDIAGVRLPGQSYVRPPTLPPEIDVEAWVKSAGLVRELSPKTLYLTHFGPYEDVERHLSALEQRLQSWLLFVEERMDSEDRQDEITADLAVMGDEELISEGSPPELSDRYQLTGEYEMLAAGLIRYVKRRRTND